MNIRAGKKLCGRKPRQAPAMATVIRLDGGRPGQVLGDGQQVGVGEERAGADADHPGRQAVQTVDEVDRVGAEHDEEHRDGHRGRVVQRHDLTGQRDPEHPDAERHHDARRPAPGRRTWPAAAGRTGRRARRPRRSPRRRSAPPGSPAAPAADDRGTAAARRARSPPHPDEHGDAAEVRHRDGVHVAVADLGQRAGPQREPAAESADQEGHRGGDQQHQQVLAHSALGPRGVGRCGRRLGVDRLGWSMSSGGIRSSSVVGSCQRRPSVACSIRLGLVGRLGSGWLRSELVRTSAADFVRRPGPAHPGLRSPARSGSTGRRRRLVHRLVDEVLDVGQRLASYVHAQRPTPQHLAVVGLGEVDDRRRAARRSPSSAAVEVDRDRVPELVDRPRRRSSAAGSPLMLALLTAIGPVAPQDLPGQLVVRHPQRHRALGRRRDPSSGWAGACRMTVSGPGQCLRHQLAWPPRGRRRPAPGSATARRSAPAAACRGRGPWRPAAAAPRPALKASAPIPYTVSVGSTMHSPSSIAARAARSAAARASRVVAGAVEATVAGTTRARRLASSPVRIVPVSPDRARRSLGPSCQRSAGPDGGDEPRPAGQIAVVADPREGAEPTTHRERRLALHLGVLEREQPAGRSSRAAIAGQHPDRVQTVVAGEQGQRSDRGRGPRPRTES